MFLENKIPADAFGKFKSLETVMIEPKGYGRRNRWIIFTIVGLVIVLCLPWTQNIQSTGQISTLNPKQRPQQINSIIAGRISEWRVKDGQLVQKGDTLALITEIKEDYLDPSQLIRVDEQIKAKDASIDFYQNKADATSSQAVTLETSRILKLNQLANKVKQYTLLVQSDSISYLAAQNQLKIADQQLARQKQLYDAGLKSLTEFEQRQQAYQDALSKKIGAENKFYNSKNELLNVKIDRAAIDQEYAEKILKTTGDRFSTLSEMATTQSEIAKLKNQLSNYSIRRGFYVIIAPQSGQVIRTSKSGIGETVKDGDPLLEIVPVQFEEAVEIFIDPFDLPLVNKGQKVRLQFDGFPAIVFSGWPNSSYGTFGGKIATVDPSISINGKFRAWVIPDENEKPWPTMLSYGSGAKGIALLKDVPVIYELWRKLNGFPPEYYTSGNNNNNATSSAKEAKK
ncbi:HlyD family secretion protein [Pedobacter cryophilus]|uniref:HlyD family efflux transporter periplasmic adaptor subunit n=1 Tax=Pedobacter cryophilus TaxID=2571271 RepID=A0A4U1BXZ7_9SPHI|nr:HlyD family efflux transporter periplasmic adaptor subunit [Pedobacter cryophilus]TKB97876.1 HlyD family efflux transporter periplasmic adaptor subunit [Pedobacter cryophilus]